MTTALYQSSDGRWLQFSMIRQVDDFDRLVIALGRPDWLIDERFATPEARIEHAEAFTQMMRAVIAERSSTEWMTLFQTEGIPAALVAEFQDLPTDPQVIANDMAMPPAEEVGMARVVRDPVNVEGVGRRGASRAPDLGEHTEEILGELGFNVAQICEFREQGVI